MKRLLIPLLAAIALPTAVNANVDAEVHKKCLEARDYAGCVNTNKNLYHKKDREITGIGIRLFLNSDTAELTIQSVINDSPAASADIQPNDVIIKGKKEKINVRLVRDTFKVPNKFYEGNLRRQLEFFFPENLKEIFPENELSPNKRRGTSI